MPNLSSEIIHELNLIFFGNGFPPALPSFRQFLVVLLGYIRQWFFVFDDATLPRLVGTLMGGYRLHSYYFLLNLMEFAFLVLARQQPLAFCVRS